MAALAFLGPMRPLLPPTGAAAESPADPFREAERVTAIDLTVELELPGARKPGKAEPPPRNLGPDDFRVEAGGQILPVVAIDPPPREPHALGTEPWTIAVYFDLPVADPAHVRWAADLLATAAPELTNLGSVEVVMAAPEPSISLPATRDPSRLQERLFNLELADEGEDSIAALRSWFLEEIHGPEPSGTPAELYEAAVTEELDLARRQMDRLLVWLAGTRPATSRRALLLVSGGYELAPEAFYNGWIPDEGLPSEDREKLTPHPSNDLAAIHQDLVRSIASFNWVVFPLPAPELDTGLIPGLRIGKWRFGPPPPNLGWTAFLRIAREEHRQPEKAEAHLELATALAAQGEVRRAQDEYRSALFHFSGDPRTADRQAEAWAGLGECARALGHEAEQRQALAQAVALDPELATRYPTAAAAELEAAQRPFDQLAKATSGRVLADAAALTGSLADLASRPRITVQLTGPPTGNLVPLRVDYPRGGRQARAPTWIRNGTPEPVADARVRRLLDLDLVDGEWPVSIRTAPDSGGDPGRLRLEAWFEPSADLAAGGSRPTLRATLAVSQPETTLVTSHEILAIEPPADPASPSLFATDIDTPAADSWIVLLIEDLDTGAWGIDLLEWLPEQ